MVTFTDTVSPSSFKLQPTILQVLPALESGGVEIETLEIAKAIVEAGGKALIASSQFGEIAQDALIPGMKFIQLPLKTKNPLRISKNARLLKDLIRQENVDIIHVRSRAPAWSAYKAARSLQIPLVTTYHAAYRSNTALKTLYNSVMARGDRVIAISEFIQQHLLHKYKKYSWFDPSRIRLIPRGIDVADFDPHAISPERLQRLRKAWQLSPGARLILLPGRISRGKGQEILIKALSLMENQDVVALFLGSARGHETYRDFLLQYAASLGLQDRVKWVPPSSDMPAAYLLADVAVCPSLIPEGFGRVMAETQAMGKPIVASNHGAAPEIIEDGITGWLTPPADALALAQAIDKVLTLPQSQLCKIGEKGRGRIMEHFSKKAMGGKTIAVYKELLKRNKK